MIPKTIHQIWLGDNKPTEWLDTFNIYPDYTLWTEKNIPTLYNQDLFDEQDRGCAKADILRYELLYRYGGVYFDADMVCLKKIPDSFLKDDFFTAYESEEYAPGLVNNAVIGCTPRHPIIKKLVEGLRTRDTKLPTWKRFGPGYLTEVLNEYEGQYKIHESKYFHPAHWKDKEVDPDRLSVAYTDHKWGTTKKEI